MGEICILSDLEIPKGKANREHYVPRSRASKKIWSRPENIFWAHCIVNAIKGNNLPCEWEETKFNLTYKAIMNWRLSKEDRKFLRRALEHWEEWHRNPCNLCLLKCKGKDK